MDQLNHQEYFRSRAATSRELAERAASPKVAAIHQELAMRYETLSVEFGHAPAGAARFVQAT